MKSEPVEDPLDRIKSEIRADADAARRRAPLPARTPTADAPDDPGTAARFSIGDLARHAGPAFVDHAYRTILHRAPDADGYVRQMAVLGSGASKLEVLGDLRYSAEGRRHGARIPGLLPRYLLAKLMRVPLLGALLQWLIAAVSLPHLLRHQRAMEASLAVRFGETATALHAAEHRDAQLHDAIDMQREVIDAQRSDLASAVTELSARLTQAESLARGLGQRVEILEQPDPDVIELRQLVLTMNHWTVQVRKSIDAIEAAEAERRARNDETSAAMVVHARERDHERAERLGAWAAELAPRIPDGATVLDLCGGTDWLAQLSVRGCKASSIETNSVLHRQARTRGLDVTLGNPAVLLARTAEHSLDALTITSLERLGEHMTLTELLREAHRVLKRGGGLLIGTRQTGLAAESATPDVLSGAGFTDAKTLDAFAAKAVFAARS